MTTEFPSADDATRRDGSALERGVRPWSEEHPIWRALMEWEDAQDAESMRGAFAALGAAIEAHTDAAVTAERERRAKLQDTLSMVHDWAALAADMGDVLGQRVQAACADVLGPNVRGKLPATALPQQPEREG